MKQVILNRNEIFQGPSPKAIETLRNFEKDHINLYADGYSSSILIPKISEMFGVSEDNILLSYGEEDFLRMIFDTLDPNKDSVLTHELNYDYYKKYLKFKGIAQNTFRIVEKNADFAFDINDLVVQYQKSKSKIVLITSPNNPTGNSLSPNELKTILENTDSETIVLVDEAYHGFDQNYDQEGFLELLRKHTNLVLLRSFSKLYALAGLRIGFALCGSNVKNLLKYQNRYLGFSRILEEVAVAALESEDYYKNLAAEIIEDREYFIQRTRQMKNFKPFDSTGNFVLLSLDEVVLGQLKAKLSDQEIVISKFVGDNFLRVTVGYREHTDRFLALLEEIDNI